MNINKHSVKVKDMTYIVGAKCTDGICLVGDTKVTIDGGTDYAYAKKIFSPVSTIVVGAAGASGMYKTFQNRLIVKFQSIMQEKGSTYVISTEKWELLAEEVIHDIAAEYGSEIVANSFVAIMATRVLPMPDLVRLTALGIPEPISEYSVIGHGEPYGSIILKTLWNRNMKMENFAKLGCFVMKYIQDMKLDNSVGIDEKLEEFPQVWYIPIIEAASIKPENAARWWEIAPIKELSKEEVKTLMKDFDKPIRNLTKAIKKIKL